MKDEPKLLFIYNSRAGKEKIRTQLLDLIQIFSEAGYEVVACPTKSAGYATQAVKERDTDCALVVCAGGDGTLDEVVCGMMQSEQLTPIGYIPGGTTNDFATSLQIPAVMTEAAKVAVYGDAFSCDVGKMNGDYFVYTAAFGLFTEVSYETKQDIKNILGHTAYLLEGVKRLGDVKSYRVRVSYDNLTIEDDFIFGMITNSKSIGGFKEITGKNVDLADGLFEVTLIRMPQNPIELSSIIAALLNRDLVSDMMYCFKTGRLIVETEIPLKWTRDGEYGGTHTRVEIENCHKRMVIKIP